MPWDLPTKTLFPPLTSPPTKPTSKKKRFSPVIAKAHGTLPNTPDFFCCPSFFSYARLFPEIQLTYSPMGLFNTALFFLIDPRHSPSSAFVESPGKRRFSRRWESDLRELLSPRDCTFFRWTNSIRGSVPRLILGSLFLSWKKCFWIERSDDFFWHASLTCVFPQSRKRLDPNRDRVKKLPPFPLVMGGAHLSFLSPTIFPVTPFPGEDITFPVVVKNSDLGRLLSKLDDLTPSAPLFSTISDLLFPMQLQYILPEDLSSMIGERLCRSREALE